MGRAVRTLSLDQEDWDRLPGSLQPHERAEQNELLSALRRAVDEDLSGEQRTVFTAVTLHGLPAAALGSNRNAIYKALFEARRILRARLAANGGRPCPPSGSALGRAALAG